ncbi:MAG: 3-phenylpropionate/trans-cinnamate dioxygenase ferredoxin reductase component, partial [Verrucomicrobiota bacterium]
MLQRDYLIIGSGIGGASACEGVRKHDKRGTITIVGAEIMAPYNRWLLSKDFLREKTPPWKKLALYDQRWFDSHKVETRF